MAEKKESKPVGRPLKYKSAKEMQERIDWYFEAIKGNSNPDAIRADLENNEKFQIFWNDITDVYPTITGLALALGFTTRDSLINYENRSDEFFDTIKKAKLRVENAIEQRLFHQNATGSIFNLKNNFGWEDVNKNEHKGDMTFNISKNIHSARDNDK